MVFICLSLAVHGQSKECCFDSKKVIDQATRQLEYIECCPVDSLKTTALSKPKMNEYVLSYEDVEGNLNTVIIHTHSELYEFIGQAKLLKKW